MIIELRKYNEVSALLIGRDPTGSHGQVQYWSGGRKVSVAMEAVCMRRMGTEV